MNPETIRHLIEQWRDEATADHEYYPDRAEALRHCADELEALLAADIATPPER